MQEKIKEIVILTTDVYFQKHLEKIPEDQKSTAKNYYEKDIDRITKYIQNNNFFDNSFCLSEEFIK